MNILFLGGQGATPDANGGCIQNMAREMISRGHEVWIIGMGSDRRTKWSEQDGATLIEYPMDTFRRLTGYNEKTQCRLFHFFL